MQASTSTRPWRRSFIRTKTGCLTCRQRRKKCDELKPSCSGCQRNRLECLWHAPVPSPTSPNSNHESHGTETIDVDLDSLAFISSPPYSLLSPDPFESPVASSSTLYNSHFHIEDVSSSLHSSLSPLDGNPSSTLSQPGITWSPDQRCFLGPTRAVLLTPNSRQLFEQYLSKTTGLLATTQPDSNPYITYIVPTACVDDLVMHSVLSLAGTHLCSLSATDLAIQQVTSQHYSLVLSTLRLTPLDSPQQNIQKTLHLLLALLILCHTEARCHFLFLFKSL